MLRIRILIAVVLAGLTVPAAALAQRSATSSERAAIVAAAVHQGVTSAAQSACLTVTVSTVNSGYASLTWPVKLSKQCAVVAAKGTIIEMKQGVNWAVVATGTSFACPLRTVPATVARDLGVCH